MWVLRQENNLARALNIREGRVLYPAKIECVENYSKSLTVKQVRNIVGLTSYYREFCV